MDNRDVYEHRPDIQSVTDRQIQPIGPKRLHRSADNRILLGVAGGVAEYFEADATVIRTLFVVGTLLGGSAVVVYVVLALIMPSEETLGEHPRAAARRTIDEATVEAQRGIDWVVSKAQETFGRGRR